MSEPSDLLPALVDSLSESTPVDWDRAFGQAGEGEEVEIVRALKDIAEIASAHRDIWRRDEAREPEALERWGPLLIEGKIGEGGYAEVFRARDPQLHRHVALKLFHPERARQLTKDTLLNEGRARAAAARERSRRLWRGRTTGTRRHLDGVRRGRHPSRRRREAGSDERG